MKSVNCVTRIIILPFISGVQYLLILRCVAYLRSIQSCSDSEDTHLARKICFHLLTLVTRVIVLWILKRVARDYSSLFGASAKYSISIKNFLALKTPTSHEKFAFHLLTLVTRAIVVGILKIGGADYWSLLVPLSSI